MSRPIRELWVTPEGMSSEGEITPQLAGVVLLFRHDRHRSSGSEALMAAVVVF